jgi:hypothetical protein
MHACISLNQAKSLIDGTQGGVICTSRDLFDLVRAVNFKEDGVGY